MSFFLLYLVEASERPVASLPCSSGSDPVFTSCVAGQNIERLFDVFSKVRQLREAHNYKVHLLERHNILVSDDTSRHFVHQFPIMFHFNALHIAPTKPRCTEIQAGGYKLTASIATII
jgi:hypothetical protein